MRIARATAAGILIGLAALAPAAAWEWPGWRGPFQTGASPETGLISTWSTAGENLLWRAEFIGRSTPVVFDGRVCAIGRVGEGITRQEVVACWHAGDGRLLWERRYNVYHTTVPFTRAGWANLSGDPETGHLYALRVNGHLLALDRDGTTVWEWLLNEEFGHYSGFGGRTHTPIVDEDRVLLNLIGSGWGEQAPLRHRVFAFDKASGEVLWTSQLSDSIADANTQSTPVVAVIGGRRLLITGGGDGAIHAVHARTGEKVWSFQLSKRGINTSVVVDGTTVYATHGEENIDEGTMGRVVAIDATGSGDVTASHEKWRVNELGVGYVSPLVHGGRLYVVDTSANLHTLDAATGRELWKHDLGNIGRGSSPVWADGKIFVGEVNGNFYVLKPGDAGAEVLDHESLTVPGGRYAEIWGSPAVAYGRVYFATEGGLYCLGSKEAAFAPSPGEPVVLAGEPPFDPAAAVAAVRLLPAESHTLAGEPVRFRVQGLDRQGRVLREVHGASFSLDGLAGSLGGGSFTPELARGAQAGKVLAAVGDLETSARVRVSPPAPWQEGFETLEAGKAPPTWVGFFKNYVVQEKDGGRVVAKPASTRGLDRAIVFFGPSTLQGYTIQIDLLATERGRWRPDGGLINSGYTLDLMGIHQKLQVRSWPAEFRMMQEVDFSWEMGVWYTLKLRVDAGGDRAVIRGKAWKRSDPEPAAWTITVEDPLPIRHGSPGLYGYSPVDIYYDNLKVTVNE